MPFSLRCYISGLVLAAAAIIALLPLSRTRPLLLLALCALVVVAERLSRVRISASGWTMSISLVVTLITVLVLAPPAAALVGLVTSWTASRSATWTWAKQIVNSGMMSLVPASGAAVCYLTGGHAPGHFLSFPEFLWPFAAAVTTCLLANGLIAAGYVALANGARFADVLRGDVKRATMPYYSSAVLALIFLSLWHDIGWYTTPLVVVPMYIAHWSLSQYAKEEAAHEGTIAALVQAVEIKDSYTRGHSERVARGAEMLAQQLKMPAERTAMLRFAGLLHDIGKLGVPTRLLTSTGGLTEEEFKLLCMHPNHGVAVLRDIRFLTEVYEGVLYHHERLDGRGYPTGKSGDQIPEFARIIGVADAFDAMTSTRSYRAARSVEEAVAELRRGAGTQFDPFLVRAFEDALAQAERSGRPWVPTELLPAEPQPDETAAAATGPWPLPKRVPGFSFADHDDPFVPVEWFSDWYPSWLAEPGLDGPGGPGGGERPPATLQGGIPGQRAGEPEPGHGAAENAGPPPTADFDDGWSQRMHSAVVREPGPEPDEGWAWDADADGADGATDVRGSEKVARLRDVSAGGGSMKRRGFGAGSDGEPRSAARGVSAGGGGSMKQRGFAGGSDGEPLPRAGLGGVSEGSGGSLKQRGFAAGSEAEPGLRSVVECGGELPGQDSAARHPRRDFAPGSDTGSMRVRGASPKPEPQPSAATPRDGDGSACLHDVEAAGDAEEAVAPPGAKSDPCFASAGDPGNRAPAPEPPAETLKPADPDSRRPAPPSGPAGPSWFSRGTPSTLSSTDPGEPPPDPDPKDSEGPAA